MCPNLDIFFVCNIPHLDRIRKFTLQISTFSLNRKNKGKKKFLIWTIFTPCMTLKECLRKGRLGPILMERGLGPIFHCATLHYLRNVVKFLGGLDNIFWLIFSQCTFSLPAENIRKPMFQEAEKGCIGNNWVKHHRAEAYLEPSRTSMMKRF